MVRIRGIGKIRGILYDFHTSEREFLRQIWQRWNNPTGQTVPVFLVGSGRSGTSMIVHHYERSWRVEVYNEDHPAVFHNWRLRDLSEIEGLLRRSYANIMLFKPLKDTYRTPVLLSRFPCAKVLFAFRHYDDVINSDKKKFYDHEGLLVDPQKKKLEDRRPPVVRWVNTDFAELSAAPPPEETKESIMSRWYPALSLDSILALHWLFVNRLFFDLKLNQDERVRLVQYESVVMDPDREFKPMCDFVGLQFIPEISRGVYSSSIKRDPPPDVDPHMRANCEDLWQRLCQQVGENNS